jgi:superfamily II DNA helicase RecQ
MPAIQSKVKRYQEHEVDLTALEQKAIEILDKRPFKWQLDVAKAVLCGKDVVIDVGTGNGKTLCFLLPLLLHDSDIGLTISPLSALMIDQVCLTNFI